MRGPRTNQGGSGGKGRPPKPERQAPERDDTDVFISEVTEELQRERMLALARRYGPFALVAIVAVIGGVAGYEIYRTSTLEAAHDAGGRLIAAEQTTQSAPVFDGLAGELDEAAVIAQLTAAGRFSDGADDDDDRARAVELYASVAANADAPARYRDLAIVRSAMLSGEDRDPAALIELLRPATAPGRPYRSIALELTAAAHLRAGDPESARAALIEARDDATTLESANARLTDQIEALEDLSPRDRPEPATPTPPAGDVAPPLADES